jgi:hypothetical protein
VKGQKKNRRGQECCCLFCHRTFENPANLQHHAEPAHNASRADWIQSRLNFLQPGWEAGKDPAKTSILLPALLISVKDERPWRIDFDFIGWATRRSRERASIQRPTVQAGAEGDGDMPFKLVHEFSVYLTCPRCGVIIYGAYDSRRGINIWDYRDAWKRHSCFVVE